MTPETRDPAGANQAGPQERTTTTKDTSPSVPGNGNEGNQRRRPSPLEHALAIIPSVFVLARHLGWPLDGDGMTYAWWRGNTGTPALSISDQGTRWFDFATETGGGPIQLLAAVGGLDKRTACQRFMQIAWEIQKKMSLAERVVAYNAATKSASTSGTTEPGTREAVKTETRDLWPELYPTFEKPTDDQLIGLARARGWPASSVRGLCHAIARGLLFTLNADKYVVTDSARLAAKLRRIDAKPVGGDSKARCLPGSENSWPLGAAAIRKGDHVVLVEGETDQLALICLLADFAPRALGKATVISLSASARIDPVALAIIKERASGVTAIGDNDEAGRRAVARWKQDIEGTGVPVSEASPAFAAPVKDISDLLTLTASNPELQDQIGAWVANTLNYDKQ